MDSDQFKGKQEVSKGKQDKSAQKKDEPYGPFTFIGPGIVFALLFVPFKDQPWSLYVAILASYTVLVYNMAFRGNRYSIYYPEIRKAISGFMLIHVLILLLISLTVFVWSQLQPMLPEGITHQYHKGSFWDLALECSLIIACVSQGLWMRKILKRNLKEVGEFRNR
jgi:amino acid transporter